MKLTRSIHRKTLLLTSFSSLMISQCLSTAQAASYSVDVGASRTHNDNSSLSNIAQSDDENQIFTHFNLEHKDKIFTAELGYAIGYTDYEDDTNNDDITTNGSSRFSAAIIPERLSWSASHQIDRYLSDRNNVNSADNQETRQSFSTGPQLSIPLSKVDQLNLSAQYSKNTFEAAENSSVSADLSDTETLGGNVRYSRSLSEISRVNVDYSYNRLEYELISPIAQFESYTIGYSSEIASGSYDVQIGSNNASFGNQPDSNGLFLAFNANKEINGQNFVFNASRRLSDPTQSTDGRNTIAESLGLTQQNSNVQDTVEKTIIKLSYSTERFCRRCEYGASFSFIEDDFSSEINSVRDEQIQLYQVHYTHNFAKNLIGSLQYSRIDTEFINSQIDDQEDRIDFDLNWRSSEKLSVQFNTSYTKRDNESTIDYDQIVISLGFTYNVINSK